MQVVSRGKGCIRLGGFLLQYRDRYTVFISCRPALPSRLTCRYPSPTFETFHHPYLYVLVCLVMGTVHKSERSNHIMLLSDILVHGEIEMRGMALVNVVHGAW